MSGNFTYIYVGAILAVIGLILAAAGAFFAAKVNRPAMA